ncbi:MAG: type II toxin-antitoxin system VapC family toxin [Candidatus Woesearchaeota archaeon]
MIVGLDSNIIIDFLEGNLDLDFSNEYVVTQITYLECLQGINPTHHKISKVYANFFDNIQILPLTNNAIRLSTKLFWDLRKKGTEIPLSDCLISQILLENGVFKLLTQDTKHFKRIPGLKVCDFK